MAAQTDHALAFKMGQLMGADHLVGYC